MAFEPVMMTNKVTKIDRVAVTPEQYYNLAARGYSEGVSGDKAEAKHVLASAQAPVDSDTGPSASGRGARRSTGSKKAAGTSGSGPKASSTTSTTASGNTTTSTPSTS